MPDQPIRRPGRPNVVMIVLDDLGFADLASFGSEIATPSIDALSESGLRFNAFHVTALCSPTRACLLTGRNHHAVGMGGLANVPRDFPGHSARLSESAGTLPRLLRDAGYSTFAVGKWHLAPEYETSPAGPFRRWPLGAGFERFYGFLPGMTNQWAPELVRDNTFIDPPASPAQGYHLTEDLASQAIRLVQDQQHAVPNKPFFLYFAPGAMHFPHHVPPTWIERYRGRFDDGWETVRERRFHRQRELGVVPPSTTLTERPSWVRPWDDLSPDERRLYARQMEVYAGFLTHTDAQVGRLVDHLGRIGVLENTLVMVLSDNGASGEGGPGGWTNLGGFTRTDGDGADLASRLAHLDELGGFRTYDHYAWGWAWAGNTPFRLWKRYAWLGGVRVPLVVHWPAGIGAGAAGQLRGQFCHAIDLMPTALDATGVQAPDMLDGFAQRPLDGASLLPVFTDPGCRSPRQTQYFEVLASRAIYHDGWKATTDHVDDVPAERELVEGSHDIDTDRWSLYCLDDDFSEAHDVAADHPGRLRRMVELWWHEAGRNGVLPILDHRSRLGYRSERLPPVPEAPESPNERAYVYLPSSGPIVVPSPVDGFRLSAEIEVPDSVDVEGVICAHGDWHCGWACYVLDGRVVVTFALGGVTSRLDTGTSIPPGTHELTVAFDPDQETGGSVTVTLNRERIGHRDLASAGGRPGLLSNETLLVGRDRGFPVSDDYEPPFPFTGRIRLLVYRVPRRVTRRDSRVEIEDALKRD